MIHKIGKIIVVMAFFTQILGAYVQFISNEQLVRASESIVLAEMQGISNTGKTAQLRSIKATIIKNELKVVESIKGSWALEKQLILHTLKFEGWMEDNVELPPVGSKVLLFLKNNEKSELKPVNGIQGVWPMHKGEPIGAGSGTTLKQIREMVQKQVSSCKSEAFTSLVNTAEIQTEVGNYKKAMEAYRKAHGICPMRDLEEQMAWLMGEVGDDEENNKAFKD